MYTDVQASGSIQVVSSLIRTAGTRCCCASASAETTTASASTTVGVSPDRRTRQVKKADHKHSTVSGAPSHQPEICLVAASTATAVNKIAPPRRRAIAYQPASRSGPGQMALPTAGGVPPRGGSRKAGLRPNGISCQLHRTSTRQDHGAGNRRFTIWAELNDLRFFFRLFGAGEWARPRW